MITAAGLTDVGKRRKLNEDTILLTDSLFLVCDGMGGHKAGEVASAVATEVIQSFIKRSEEDREMTWPYGYDTRISYSANRLRTAIKLANRAVFRKAASADDYTGMGTTVSAAIVPPGAPGQMTYAHVGDSRIYLVRRGIMLQLTRDDSWANLGWSATDDPATSAMKNILTKALGARDDVDFDVVEQALQDDDLVLLCSDGLTNMVPDARIQEVIALNTKDLERGCRELVDEANAAGGRDNISVILLHYRAA
jgi:protein phosphatase